MKVEFNPTKAGGEWKKQASLLVTCVWQRLFFSPFILHPLSWLHVSFITVFLFFCLSFRETDMSASAAPLAEIQRRGYLTIAVKDNLRPLGFRDAQGNLQGLEIDLAQRLAKDILGKTDAVKLQPVTNRDRLSVVFNQQVDLTIARVTATASRSRLVAFSVPYYLDSTILVTKDTSIQQLSNLAKRKIAVLNNSSTVAQVKYFIPKAELVGVNSYQEAREKIESNAADAFAADGSVLSGWVQEYPQYRLLPDKLSGEPLSVVMPKGLQYDELRRKVNEAIARYLAENWLKERIQYWELP
jgi:polar amino acid transport system substrate-binding protein